MNNIREGGKPIQCYEDVESAARQAKTQRELCQINEEIETLFWQDKLKITDDDWIKLTSLIGELHPTLPP